MATLGTFVTGQVLTAAELNAIGTWTTYTPTWTSTGTAPAIGNGTLTGRYVQVNKLVIVNIFMEFGSTTTAGTGTYYWGLPVASGSLFNGEFNGAFGNASIRDAGIATYRGMAELNANDTDNTNVRVVRTDANAAVTNTSPMTWGTGDHISLLYIYESA